MSGFKCPDAPEEFTARIFLLHACALQDPPRDCLEIVREARQRGVSVFTTVNDRNYVFSEMADKYGVKSDRRDEKLVLDILETFFKNKIDDPEDYAAPNILKATYEFDKKFRNRKTRMTGNQIAFALCGLLLTMTGKAPIHGGAFGSFYLLSGLVREEVEEVVANKFFKQLLQQARDMPKDVSVSVKRLYFSAFTPPVLTPIELAIAERDKRANVIYVQPMPLYDLIPYEGLRKALEESVKYLHNDKVKRIAEFVASRVQMFFGSVQEVRGRRCGDARWLYDALRELHRLRDEEGAVGRYSSIMYRGLSDLLSGAC